MPSQLTSKSAASDIKALLVQSSALNEPTDYRVYRIGEATVDPMNYERQPGGKDLMIMSQTGQWPPGAYMSRSESSAAIRKSIDRLWKIEVMAFKGLIRGEGYKTLWTANR